MLFTGKKKILIIEDDPINQELLHDILNEYNLTSATLGTEGLQLIEQNKYDLLILDLKLPDISGIEILKHTRPKKLKTILMTGYLATFIKEEMIMQDLENIIQKPFKVEYMKEAVRHALEN